MGGSNTKDGVKKPVVVVIGGGYAGVNVSKQLDKCGQFYVVLIDRKDHFVHNIAALRATVEQNYASNILIPYKKLLSKGNGIVVNAEVTEISTHHVKVYGREEPIHFDYLVIATGSSYAFPAKLADPYKQVAYNKYDAVYTALKKSNNVIIIGGGPVGVELCGEIATEYPNKTVTLIHAHTELVGSHLNSKFHERVTQQLTAKKVKIVLGERAISNAELEPLWNSTYLVGERRVKTDKNGEGYLGDIVFFTTGTVLNNKSLLTHFSDRLDEQTGRVKVNAHLQVEGHTNIFALGDIANAAVKMAFYAQVQAPIVCDNIIALHNKNPTLKSWTSPPHPAMFLSIGKNGGVGQLPNASGTIFGKKLVTFLKSSGLFVTKYWALLNANYKQRSVVKGGDEEKEEKDGAVDDRKLAGLIEAMSLTEEAAKKLIRGLPVVEERKEAVA